MDKPPDEGSRAAVMKTDKVKCSVPCLEDSSVLFASLTRTPIKSDII